MNKRILCFIIVLSLFVGTNAFAIQYKDVDSTKASAIAVEFLSELGIITGYDDDTFRPDNMMTRAEFAVILGRMIRIDEQIDRNDVYFIDVPAEHWAAGSIAQLVDMNILSGKNDGRFGTDDEITVVEAATALLRMCGYGELCELKGGYPSGYTSIAYETGIINRGFITSESMNRLDVAKLIYNAMQLGYYSIVSIKGDSASYKTSDETILSQYWNMYPFEGIMTAAGCTEMYSGKTYSDKTVVVDNIAYDNGGIDCINYIGNYVEGFYESESKDDYDKSIVYISKTVNENEETLISYKDIVSVDDNLNITYYKNDKTKKQRLNSDVSVIYNGAVLDSFSPEDIEIDYGEITLVETENNGISVVRVWEYENFIISSLDKENEIVYGGGGTVLDLSNDNTLVELRDANGEMISFDKIKVDDLITYAVNPDKKIIRAYVSNNTITGELSGIDNENNEITIGDVAYGVIPEIFNNLISEIKLSSTVTVYLDFYENVAGINNKNVNFGKYAYLINAMVDTGIEERVLIKLFEMSGKIERYPTREKGVTIDGIKYTEPETIIEALSNSGEVTSQLVCLKFNADNEIVYIDTPQYNSGYENEYSLRQNIIEGSYRFKSGAANALNRNSINGKGNLDASTVVFEVPNEDIKHQPQSGFAIKKGSNYSGTQVLKLSSYKTSPMVGYEEVCVVKRNIKSGTLSDNSPVVVISKISKTLNSDDDVVYKFDYFHNGEEKSVIASADPVKDFSQLNKGDAVRFYRTANDEVANYEFKSVRNDSYLDQVYDGIEGYVFEKQDGVIRIGTNDMSEWNFAFGLGNAKCTIIEKSDGDTYIRAGTMDEIRTYRDFGTRCDKIFLHVYYADVISIIVMRES